MVLVANQRSAKAAKHIAKSNAKKPTVYSCPSVT
jgi:hypothetical protein